MTKLYEYQKKIVNEIENFIKTAEVESYELTEAFKEHSKNNPGGIDFNEKTWRQYIWDSKEAASADKYKGWILEIVNNLAKMKREKAKQEKKSEDQKKKDEADYWKEYYKENADYWKKSSEWWSNYNANKYDWQKDDVKREAENQKFYKQPDNKDDFDEKKKKEYIGDVEMYLAKENVSGERLNERLGVSDWREKINQATGWNDALWKSSDLKDIIRQLKKEYTCSNCGVKKEEYTAYGVGSKKACSWECEKALKGEDKGVDKDEAKEIKKELQEIKDYLKKNNENAIKVLNNLLIWMKKGGVINITLSNDKMVVELSGNKTKTIEESDLTSEQRAVKNFLQSSSDKKSISRSEVEKMVGRNYNEEGGNKGKNGNAGIIAAIVVVTLVLVVVIGVVVNKNKKRDY